MASDAKTRRLDRRAAVDRLSNLPPNLIDLIIGKLSLHDAARTSILSEKWRYIWAMQPHLVFDELFFSQLISKMVSMKYKQTQLSEISRIISSILLVHIVPVSKFHLSIPQFLPLHQCTDMICWIRNISINGVKEFELFNKQIVTYEMPSYLFSCLELTHLSLTNCTLNPPTRFGGFCNLISVKLVDVIVSADMSFGTRLVELSLEHCTGIEHLGCQFKYNNNLRQLFIYRSREIDWEWFKCTQKVETLFLRRVTNPRKKFINLNKFVGNMPGITSLALDGSFLKFLEPGAPISKRLITTMENLKFLVVYVEIYDLVQIQNVLCLIRSSPNLRKIYIRMVPEGKGRDGMDLTVSLVEQYLELPNFNDMILGQLETVEIWGLVGSKAELHFIKLLLATSPSLRWMKLEYDTDPEEESRISRELLRFPRASSAAQIIWT